MRATEHDIGVHGIGVRSWSTWSLVVLVCLALSIAPGCTSLGPARLTFDRFDYNKSVAQSSNQQLLLNIVRLRYGEPLHWLEVSSMTSQYSFEANFSANRWENDLDVWQSPALRAVYGVDGDPSRQSGVDGGVAYSDRPTISYAPVRGLDFSRRLLSPIPISVIFFFVQAGWPIDEVLQLCVDRMCGLTNAVSPLPAAKHETGDAERFDEALDLLRATQVAGRLQGSIESAAKSDELVLVLDTRSASKFAARMSELLGIDASVTRLRLTPHGFVGAKDELAMQTRSLLATMKVLSRYVEVPVEHVEHQMTIEWPEHGLKRGWLSIQYSPVPKLDAFVQIKHKGHWFYIADDDVQSKRTFAMLTYLYSLQASDVSGTGPVLTLPAGR